MKSSNQNLEKSIFYSFYWVWFIYEAMAGYVFEKQSIVSVLFGGFFTVYLLLKIFSHRIVTSWLRPYYYFWLYLLILVIFSSRIDYSFKVYSQSLIPALFLPLAFYYIRRYSDLLKLSKSLIIFLIVYLVNVFIAQYFGLGGTTYARKQYDVVFGMGNIFTTGLNSVTYVLILIPWMNRNIINPSRRVLLLLLAISSFITLLLAAKRISISGVLLGIIILFLFQTKRKMVVKYIAVIGIAITISFPLYAGIILRQIEIREDRLKIDNLEQEGRFLETIAVYDEIFSFNDLFVSIFGKEMFNSPYNYGQGRFGDRQLHSDYNVILHGSGIFGLLFYFYIHIVILKRFLFLKKEINPISNQYSDLSYLNGIFISFFVVSFWISLSGGINGIVYNAIKNAFLGGILSYYEILIYQSRQLRVISENKN